MGIMQMMMSGGGGGSWDAGPGGTCGTGGSGIVIIRYEA